MKLHRLVIENDRGSTAVDFHEQLTLVWSDAPNRRAAVVDDLFRAIGRGRPGLHAELVDADNRHVVVFRPNGGPPRVIVLADSSDVTETYAVPGGEVDVFGRAGLDAESARSLMVLTAAEVDGGVDTGTDDHGRARALSGIDPDRLWPAAERVSGAHDRLTAAQAEAGGELDSIADFERVEDMHHETAQIAQAYHRDFRFGMVIAAVCLAVAFVTFFVDRWTSNGLAILGLLALALTLTHRRHLVAARREEKRAINQLGAVDFAHLRGMMGPLANGEVRADLLSAHRELVSAQNEWNTVIGEPNAEADTAWRWALANREAVGRLAQRRETIDQLGDVAGLAPIDGTVADSARVLVDRLVELRQVGMTQEPLPLIVFDALAGLAPGDRRQVLAVLTRLSERHQVVVVSGDAAVREWLLEAAGTGAASVTDLDTPVVEMVAAS